MATLHSGISFTRKRYIRRDLQRRVLKKNDMTSKEYLMQDETSQIEFQAHLFKNIPDHCRTLLCVCYHIAKAEATHCGTLSNFNDCIYFRNVVFLQKPM